MPNLPRIAYFSAEFGLEAGLPIYAGGLGILAGDILKQAADEKLPIIGIGLFYHHGFFQQKINAQGRQTTQESIVHPRELDLEVVDDPQTGKPLEIRIDFPSEPAKVRVWQKTIAASSSASSSASTRNTSSVRLYLLDAAVPENETFEVEYTGHLYEGDWAPKVAQEIILGVGGVRLIRKLGLKIDFWHLNDDHAAFSILERLKEALAQGDSLDTALTKVKQTTVFTTHTPVAGAESTFDRQFIRPYIEKIFPDAQTSLEAIMRLGESNASQQNLFSLSVLSLRMSRKINAVSQRHAQVSRKLWSFVFPPEKHAPIIPITNGVHVPTWVAKPMQTFYRKWLGTNFEENISNPQTWSRLVLPNSPSSQGLPDLYRDLWQARQQCKRNLINQYQKFLPQVVKTKSTDLPSSPNHLFLGFARRFAPYKQANLLTHDLKRLAKILTNPTHPVYLFISGKAHYSDQVGQTILQQIIQASQDPRVKGRIIFLENYNLELAQLLIPGVDLWLNTPLPPMEASGTSGMKALYNGVLNLSVADGWWWEVVNKLDQSNRLGWVLGRANPVPAQARDVNNFKQQSAQDLYDLLEKKIVPLYYQRKDNSPIKWLEIIRQALLTLGPFYNTQRLLKQYYQELFTR